jgi:hypothetical protein
MEYVCIHSDGTPVLGDLSAAAGGNRSFAGRPVIFVLVISPYRPITNVIPLPDSGAVFFTSDIKFLAVLPIIAMEMMSFLGFYQDLKLPDLKKLKFSKHLPIMSEDGIRSESFYRK